MVTLRSCSVMTHSRVLRIDHVMGLHRLFVIPPGHDASAGLYIRYHPEESYAILSLESHRSGTMLHSELRDFASWIAPRPCCSIKGSSRSR